MLTSLDPGLEAVLWLAALILVGIVVVWAVREVREAHEGVIKLLEAIGKMFAGNN